MLSYVIRRVATAFVVVFIVISLSFFLVRLMPGNAVQFLTDQLERQGNYTPQEIQQKIAAVYGILPKSPVWRQYLTYVGHAFRGNLGTSILNPGETVVHIVGNALPWTIFSVGVALLISFGLGVGVGTVMAVFQSTRFTKVVTLVVSFLSAVPNYVAAILLIYFLADRSGVFPSSGAYAVNVTPGPNPRFIGSVLFHAILPISAYVITAFGGWALTMKGAAISTIGAEYVRSAESRGLLDRRIARSYVGRNSLLPMVTSLALSLGYVFGGSVFIETYFSYPGIGYYLIQAVTARDYSLMMGCFILITVSVVLANLLVDLLYPLVDPRIARPATRRGRVGAKTDVTEAAVAAVPVGSKIP